MQLFSDLLYSSIKTDWEFKLGDKHADTNIYWPSLPTACHHVSDNQPFSDVAYTNITMPTSTPTW